MANLKSAKKAIRQTKTRTARNKTVKRVMKSNMKEIRDLVAKGEGKKAGDKLSAATKKIDKAAKVGVIHKNTASRYKSRLTKAINKATKAKKS